MAVFGIPQVHEDDALRAARAAIELRDSVAELNVRIGVNTGEVVAGSGETLVTGDAVNVAARLEQAAEPGTILLGEQTYRLLRDAVDAEPVAPIDAKGKSEPVTAHTLERVHEDAAAFARRLDAPLVGRADELDGLEETFARATHERSCQLVTLLGPPGIGKSRLAYEIAARLAERARVVRGHCLSYGAGITYWPLVQMLRGLGDASGLLTLLEESARPEEASRAVRRLFEGLARERPLVVLVDDVHWAEPTFLDLIEHIADLSRDAPILLVCLARPELLDARPGWGGGRQNATNLLLEPLSSDEAETLIATLAGSDLDDAVRERIAAAADGNPLFVEQMLAMLGEDGADGDVAVPPTIRALLAVRIDRLEPAERTLLEHASVVGKEFWLRAVVDLDADPAALPALARKELIQPYRSSVFPDDDAYRFRHDLIRDAAYEALPKAMRAELHERAANWLRDQLSEFEEIVGYHLEQAHRYRAELGEPDETLAGRAGEVLGKAGLRAADRADVPAAINLLSRAVELLPEEDARRVALLPDLAYAHFDAGAFNRADEVFVEAEVLGSRTGLPVCASRAAVGRLGIFAVAPTLVDAAAALESEIAKLERLGDPKALAEAYREAAKLESGFGRTEQAVVVFEEALANAKQSGSRRIEADVILWRLAMQCWGYLPASAGIRDATELLDQGAEGMAKAFALVVRGRYRALQGDLEGGRADMATGRSLIREYGAGMYVAGSAQENAQLELEAGNPAAAELAARESFELYMRDAGHAASAALLVGRALVDQGRFDEASRFAQIGKEDSETGDASHESEWRAVEARVLAARGELETAETLARDAVGLAAGTDYLEFHAHACLALADVLAKANRYDEAASELHEAIRLYEQKESVLAAERVRVRLRELAREPLAERD